MALLPYASVVRPRLVRALHMMAHGAMLMKMETFYCKRRRRLLIVWLTLLAPVAPGAQETGASVEEICRGDRVVFALPSLGVFDNNDDHEISADEAAGCATLQVLFARLDIDASGSLSRAEYSSFPDLWRHRARTFEDPLDEPGQE